MKTKLEFLEIISIQRHKLIEEHQKPGWNLWVLCGGFASLLWLMISIFEENKFDLTSSVFISIFIYIAFNVLKPLQRLITNWSSDQKSKYVHLRNEMTNSLPSIFFGLTTLIFVYAFIVKNATGCPNYQMILFKIFSCVILVMIFIIFLLSYVDFPIKSKTESPAIKKIATLTLLVILILSLNPLFIIYPHLHLDDYPSLKLGLVFFSLHFITFKLLSTSERNLLLNQIDELIDDITFDNKNVTEGESILKLIIYGLQFNAIISPLINEHLELSKAHKENCDLIIERLMLIKSENDVKQQKLLEDALSTQFAILEKTYPLISKSRNKIIRKLSFYYYSEQHNPDYNNIQTLLNNLENERNNKWNELKNQVRLSQSAIRRVVTS